MPQLPNLRVIRTKKQELLAAAARYDELSAKARAEAAEFDAAERVWMKLFGADSSPSEGAHNEQDQSRNQMPESLAQMPGLDLRSVRSDSDNGGEARRKPSGLPPVPEMILEALRLAEAEGKAGMNPQAMVSYVRSKYWSEATNPDIGSTMWRMWKDGRLAKPDENSSVYVIARHQENAA
jgi:hypothetical protein